MTIYNQDDETVNEYHVFIVEFEDNDNEYPHEWIVELPHQCEGWQITNRPTKEQAITDMKSFIRKAQEALVELENLA